MNTSTISNLLPRRTAVGEPAVQTDCATARRPAIDSLNSLRGLAALWVVFYHFANDLVVLLPQSRPLLPFFRQGDIAVPMFFVLSGFVLTYNYLESIGERFTWLQSTHFWARRLLRIYPLHLATLLVVLGTVAGARVLGFGITDEGYSARDFVLNLFLMQTWVPHFRLNWNYPSWSISSEWFAYLFFPFVCLGFIRIRRLSTLLGLCVLFYAVSVGHQLYRSRLIFSEMIAVVGPFLLGCTFARMVGLGYVPRFGLRLAAWLLLFSIVLVPFVLDGRPMIMSLLTFGTGLVFVLGASGPDCSRFWVCKPLVGLGAASYSLYLVHTIVQKLMYELAPSQSFAGRPLSLRLLILVLYAGAIAATTWLAYASVELYFRKSLRRWLSI